MSDLEELIREVATFKTTHGGGVRLVDDRGDVIVMWPKGCPDAPTTRDEAIEKALAMMRGARIHRVRKESPMKTRTYTAEEIDSRIAEFQELTELCDETITLIDQILDRTYGSPDAAEARAAILRVRATAQRAELAWVERRPVP